MSATFGAQSTAGAAARHDHRDGLFSPGGRLLESVAALDGGARSRFVRVLDADPDLAAALDPEQRKLAHAAAVAPLFTHRSGPWEFFPPPDRASLGALILDGLIVVRIEVDGRGHVELLGEGDVTSPWAGMGAELTFPTIVTARVVSDLRLALLDRRFALRTARWPEIHAALVQRLITRSRRASLQSAINSLPRIEERLELTFWHLAERFGKVTPEGCRVRLRFTHAQLAEAVAAQRPSVSVALARLAARRRVLRLSKDEWLLCAPAPAKLDPLVRQTGLRG